MKFIKLITVVLSFFISIDSFSQKRHKKNQQRDATFEVYSGGGIMLLNKKIMDDNPSIDPVPKGAFIIGGDFIYQHFNSNLEVSYHSFKDSESFSQLKTNGVQESNTAAFNVTFGLGANHKIQNFDLRFNVGYNWVFASRGIADCLDCDSEKIILDNGLAFRPKLIFNFTRELFSFSSFEYYTSKHKNGLILLGFGFRPKSIR